MAITDHRCDHNCPQRAVAVLHTRQGPLYFCAHHTRVDLEGVDLTDRAVDYDLTAYKQLEANP